MTITHAQALDAAFWGRAICLECGTEVEEDEDSLLGDLCPSCQTPAVYSGKLITTILNQVEGDSE
jgi:Zn finger protein HypA/HybF involved in hydrogenase expression